MAKLPAPGTAAPDLSDAQARAHVATALVENAASRARPYLLPEDLPKALRWLADDELETLAKSVSTERHRRSLPADREADAKESKKTSIPTRPVVSAKPKRQPQEPNTSTLTQSRINAIRAAFKAGVKPSMIARQFGVSQAAIRDALSDKSD